MSGFGAALGATTAATTAPAAGAGAGSGGFGAALGAAAAAGGGGAVDFRAQVLDIYQKHNPSKIGEVDKLMAKYA